MSTSNEAFIEALSRHIENEVISDFKNKIGNVFCACLGGDFIDDIKRTILGKVDIVDHDSFTIRCVDGKLLTVVIKPNWQSIEIILPGREKKKHKGEVRTGVLKPCYAHIWKSFITLAYARYNASV